MLNLSAQALPMIGAFLIAAVIIFLGVSCRETPVDSNRATARKIRKFFKGKHNVKIEIITADKTIPTEKNVFLKDASFRHGEHKNYILIQLSNGQQYIIQPSSMSEVGFDGYWLDNLGHHNGIFRLVIK